MHAGTLPGFVIVFDSSGSVSQLRRLSCTEISWFLIAASARPLSAWPVRFPLVSSAFRLDLRFPPDSTAFRLPPGSSAFLLPPGSSAFRLLYEKKVDLRFPPGSPLSDFRLVRPLSTFRLVRPLFTFRLVRLPPSAWFVFRLPPGSSLRLPLGPPTPNRSLFRRDVWGGKTTQWLFPQVVLGLRGKSRVCELNFRPNRPNKYMGVVANNKVDQTNIIILNIWNTDKIQQTVGKIHDNIYDMTSY